MLEKTSFRLLTTVIPKTTEETAGISRLKAKLKSVVDAEIVSMVTRGVTEEGRLSFLQRLREAGSGDYREIFQQAYDRWQGDK